MSEMKNKFFLLTLSGLILVIYWIIYFRKSSKHSLKSYNHSLWEPFTIYADKCKESTRILFIVTSYIAHVQLRNAHRRAMPQKYLDSFNASRLFLLAGLPTSEIYVTQSAILKESAQYNDILQGGFVEHYRNLTYKHLMGLSWASSNCTTADYVIKIDDDTVFDFESIHSLLNEHKEQNHFILGYILNDTKPHRERDNKWYVSYDEYPQTSYPPYVSGWLYITTPRTALSIVKASFNHPYFWIDDIFVTGILPLDIDIKLFNLKEKKIWLEYYELLECCLRDMVEENIKCEYAVSPNGGRDNLIYEFNEALRKCKLSRDCKFRTGKTLKETCVVEAERTVFGKGESLVLMVHL